MKKWMDLMKQIIKFGVVGVFSTLLDYGLMIFFKEICSLHYLLASTLSYSISLVFNYVASMKYVFQSKEDVSKWKEFFAFTILCLIGMGINQFVLCLIVESVSMDYRISKIFATMVVMVWNFVTRKLFLEKK